MFDVSSSTQLITSALSNTGVLIALVLSSVVVGVIALMGVGYAIRHIGKRLLGRKF